MPPPLSLTTQCDTACESALYDLRCNFARPGESTPYFHRIVDCLLPLHTTLSEALSDRRSRPCVVAEHGALLHLVSGLFPSLSVVDADSACGQRSLRHASELKRAAQQTPSPSAWRAFRRDLVAPRGMLSSWRPAARASASVLLIERLAARRFLADSAERLRAALRRSTGRAVLSYFGNESVADTVRLFAAAAGVVGYHGAGLANAMFTPRPQCVLEYSCAFGGDPPQLWRSNGPRVAAWTPMLRWDVLVLPLTQLLSTNAKRGTEQLRRAQRAGASSLTGRAKETMEHLSALLTPEDVEDGALLLQRCLTQHVSSNTTGLTGDAALPANHVHGGPAGGSTRLQQVVAIAPGVVQHGLEAAAAADAMLLTGGLLSSSKPAAARPSRPKPTALSASRSRTVGTMQTGRPSRHAPVTRAPAVPAKSAVPTAVPTAVAAAVQHALTAKSNATCAKADSPSRAAVPAIRLMSIVMGNSPWRAHSLPLFLKSLRGAAAVHLAIIGDAPPPSHVQLPPNAVHVPADWPEMAARLERLSGVAGLGKTALGRRVTDLKPALGALFPELLAGYAWFGWVDLDVMLSGSAFGSLAASLHALEAKGAFGSPGGASSRGGGGGGGSGGSPGVLLVRSHPMQLCYGPLALFRSHGYAGLMRGAPWAALLGKRSPFCRNFDEWGQFFAGMGYNQSCSGMLLQAAASPATSSAPLRVAQLRVPIQLDDGGEDREEARTGLECRLAMDANGVSHLLGARGEPILFCHLHNRKHAPPLRIAPPTATELSGCEVVVRAGASNYAPTDPSPDPQRRIAAASLAVEMLPARCFQELGARTQLLGGKAFAWEAPLAALSPGACDVES